MGEFTPNGGNQQDPLATNDADHDENDDESSDVQHQELNTPLLLSESLVSLPPQEPSVPIHEGLEYEGAMNNQGTTTLNNNNNRESESNDKGSWRRPSSTNDDDDSPSSDPTTRRGTSTNWDLRVVISFVGMVAFGTANVVLTKLEAVPMYNYPNLINLWLCFLYIPICFAYILPVAKMGNANSSSRIPPQHWNMSKRPFMLMGFLDSLACTMVVLSSVYLPGPLLVLLPQASIPISMLFSYVLLRQRYTKSQFVGAALVILGLAVVLEPLWSLRGQSQYVCQAWNEEDHCTVCQSEWTQEACLSHVSEDPTTTTTSWLQDATSRIASSGDENAEGQLCHWVSRKELGANSSSNNGEQVFWAIVLIISCIPLTLSTIYKEISLNGEKIDAIFLNGWVAVYQFGFTCLAIIPAGLVSTPSLGSPALLWYNLVDGWACLFQGEGSIHTGCHPDECAGAGLLVHLALIANLGYTLFMMLMIQYGGGSSTMFLAMTLMVPLGNLAFWLPGVKSMGSSQPTQDTSVHWSDLVGLCVILFGLGLYRWQCQDASNDEEAEPSEEVDQAVLAEAEDPPALASAAAASSTLSAQESSNDLREPLLPRPVRMEDV